MTLAQFAANRVGLVAGTAHKRGWYRIPVGLVLALLIFEQVNVGTNVWVSRAAEAVHFSAVRQAPSKCRAFFVAPQPALTESQNQTDAMMVAHRIRLPTLNGTTGINPRSHPLAQLLAPDYQRRALAWAAGRDTLDGLCRLDIPTGEWLPWTELDIGPKLAAGDSIALNNSGDWSSVLIKGWSGPEDWGVWSDGPEAKLLLPLASSGDPGVALEITTRAFVPAGYPALTVTVTAADETLAVWQFTREAVRSLVLDIPRRAVSPVGLLLAFKIQRPESPRRLGLHDDGRLLGLGLHRIRVIR
jgi:hypothetical protein